MIKHIRTNVRFILFLLLCMIIAGVMVYKDNGPNLKKTQTAGNYENPSAGVNFSDTQLAVINGSVNPDEKKIKNIKSGTDYSNTAINKVDTEELIRLVQQLTKEKQILKDSLNILSGEMKKCITLQTDSRDTLVSSPPVYASLKTVDAENFSDEIEKLKLLQKPGPKVSFSPSVSQGESRINANTTSTVSLLRVKSVKPNDIGIKFKFDPEIGKDFLNIKPEYRGDEIIYKITFNFRNKGQLDYFLDKYESSYYDPNKNNCFIRVSLSVYDKVTEKKFDNLDQAFKVFFYRYE